MDWFVAWSVDDYVDWQPAQQQQFDRHLDEFLHWHQSTQLTRYADLLSDLKHDLKQPLSAPQLNTYLNLMDQLWQDILANAAPRARDLLAQLDDQQVASIAQNVDKKYRKRHRKYLDGDQAEWQSERLQTALDNISDLVGRLSDPQKQRIQQWNQALTHVRQQWVAHQRSSAELFHQALLARHNLDFGEQINQLMLNQDALRDAEYQALINHNTSLTIALTIDLQHSLSIKQQRHLAKTLNNYIEDLTALATPR